tara:strand:+ start:8130 stop:8780 length:651 start_codon:yes stop_codon:yes gene_type:complete
MPITAKYLKDKKDKREKKEKEKKEKKRVKKEVLKQKQKQSQSVVVNVVAPVRRRRTKPKPLVVPQRPTFIQTFQPQPQFNVPTIDQLVSQGQGQGIRLGGREPALAKTEFYEPVKEAIAVPFEADSNIGRHTQEPLVPFMEVKGKAGRPKKYNTDDEKRLAKIEASKRFREREKRRKEEEAIREAPNRIVRRNLIDDEAITDLQDFMNRDFMKDPY